MSGVMDFFRDNSAAILKPLAMALGVVGVGGCVMNPAQPDAPVTPSGKRIELSKLKETLTAGQDYIIYPTKLTDGTPVNLYIATMNGLAYRPMSTEKPGNVRKALLNPLDIHSKTQLTSPTMNVVCYGTSCTAAAYVPYADAERAQMVEGLKAMHHVQTHGQSLGLDFAGSFRILEQIKIGDITDGKDGTYIFNQYITGAGRGPTIVSCQWGKPIINFEGPVGPTSVSVLPPGIQAPPQGKAVILSEAASLNGGTSLRTGLPAGVILRANISGDGINVAPVGSTQTVGPDAFTAVPNLTRPEDVCRPGQALRLGQ